MCISLGTINWIYVSRSARDQNISTALMKMAMAWMRNQGAEAAEVFVTKSSAAAVRCYERSRFQRVDLRMIAALSE